MEKEIHGKAFAREATKVVAAKHVREATLGVEKYPQEDHCRTNKSFEGYEARTSTTKSSTGRRMTWQDHKGGRKHTALREGHAAPRAPCQGIFQGNTSKEGHDVDSAAATYPSNKD